MPFAAAPPAEIAADPWTLRLPSEADWGLGWEMSRDPDVVRWTLFPPAMIEEAARRRSRSMAEPVTARVAGRFAVLDADEVAVGTAGIAGDEGDPTGAEVFYALLPHGRHRGAATAPAIALSRWAFSVGVERVVLLTIPGNGASEAVARRAGFLPAWPPDHSSAAVAAALGSPDVHVTTTVTSWSTSSSLSFSNVTEVVRAGPRAWSSTLHP